MSTLALELRPVGVLDPACRDAMFALLGAYFDGVSRDEFDRDLAEKDQVMLLTEREGGRLAGFSTLMRLAVPTSAGEALVVFSGDTAVAQSSRSFWGFAYGLDRYFAEAREHAAGRPAYYVLSSKGWRTYRVLAALFRRFYPGCLEVTPRAPREVIAAFAAKKYPGAFDARRGVLPGRPNGPRIRPDGPDVVPVHRLADPHVDFFARANPGHERGDELVCIADIAPENYSATFRRMLRRQRADGAWTD